MKMVKVVASDNYLKQEIGYFRFNEAGELISSISDLPAWFDSKEGAIETLTQFGFDEVDFAAMEFIEFEYIPKIPGESEFVATPANIYINGIGFTTLSEELHDFTEETYDIIARDPEFEIVEEGEF